MAIPESRPDGPGHINTPDAVVQALRKNTPYLFVDAKPSTLLDLRDLATFRETTNCFTLGGMRATAEEFLKNSDNVIQSDSLTAKHFENFYTGQRQIALREGVLQASITTYYPKSRVPTGNYRPYQTIGLYGFSPNNLSCGIELTRYVHAEAEPVDVYKIMEGRDANKLLKNRRSSSSGASVPFLFAQDVAPESVDFVVKKISVGLPPWDNETNKAFAKRLGIDVIDD